MSASFEQPALFPESDIPPAPAPAPEVDLDPVVEDRRVRAGLYASGVRGGEVSLNPDEAERVDYLGAVVLHRLEPDIRPVPKPHTVPQNAADARRELAAHKDLQRVADKAERERWVKAVAGDSGHYAAFATWKARRKAKQEAISKHLAGKISGEEAHNQIVNTQYIEVRKPHAQHKAEKKTEKAERRTLRHVGLDDSMLEHNTEPTYEQLEIQYPKFDKDDYLNEAIRVIGEFQHASPAVLHRHLPINFEHAKQLINSLEELGLIGPEMPARVNGPDPRRVFIPQPPRKERGRGRERERNPNDDRDRGTERDAEYWHQARVKLQQHISEQYSEYTRLFTDEALKALDVRIAAAISKSARERMAEENIPKGRFLPAHIFKEIKAAAKESVLSRALEKDAPLAVKENLQKALSLLAHEENRIPAPKDKPETELGDDILEDDEEL